MSMQNRKRQEELCVYRYRKNCRALEDKEDEVREQERALEQISESLHAHTMRMNMYLESYATLCGRKDYERVATHQNELLSVNSDAQYSFSEHQEHLLQTKRKLEDEREELERAYRKELRSLREKD